MNGVQKIINGLILIISVEPKADFSAQHDVIYCGSSLSYEKMTPEQLIQMNEYGWIFEKYIGCWAIYV